MRLIIKEIYIKLGFIIGWLLLGFVGYGQPKANFSSTPISGCAPLTVNFQDLSTGLPTSWQWDLGNTTISYQQSPSTTYFTAGTYTVSLKVSNDAGSDSITFVQYITVYNKPTVNFSASSLTGCFPLRDNFTDLSTAGSGTITNWSWDFGNGDTSSLKNPSYKYTAAGNYSVTLKVTNSGGCTQIANKIQYIKIPNGVTPNFSNSSPVHCRPPELINFSNLSAGPGTLSYKWSFGDGNTSTLLSPSNNYLIGGSYSIQLIVTSNVGCIDTLVKQNSLVIPNFTTVFSGPDSVCFGATANFTNTSSPVNTNSIWNFGDGSTSTLNTPSKLWSTAGTYQVKLINDYGVCIDSVSKPVKMLSPIIVNFFGLDTFNCKPSLTTVFTNQTPGSTQWNWNFGDGITSTVQNPSHTYSSYNQFTVTLTTTNAIGCGSTLSKPAYIKILKPSYAIGNLPAGGCIPFTYSPTISTITGDPKGIATYLWDFGDGATSSLKNPSNIYSALGTYTIKFYYTTNDGCSDSSVFVNGVKTGTPPTVSFMAAPLVQCAAQNIQFTDTSPGPLDTWSWNFGDGAGSTLQNPLHPYQVNGLFNVTLTGSNNGCATSVTKTSYIQILPPIAKFTPVFSCANKTTVAFTDNSISPQTWTWDFGDGTTSTTQSPTHIYSALGGYNVKLTVTNAGCSTTKIIPIIVVDEHPDFTTQKDSICRYTGISIISTNINKANIILYTYAYGDGYIVSGPNFNPPSHIYTTPGVYPISVTTTDIHNCPAKITKPNKVSVFGPTAKFGASPLSGCKGLNVTFTDSSTITGNAPIKNWQWSYGDGIIQNLTAPPFGHIYTTTGSFNAKLKVTDSLGCYDSLILKTPIQITIPKIIFISPDTLACIGKNVSFSNTSTGTGNSYLWVLGNGDSSTLQNPHTSYLADGNYPIKLIGTDINGCKDSLQKNNYIKVKTEKAAFTISDSVSSCTPFAVNFTNTSINSVSQSWDFGDGSSSSSKNPSHYYFTPGTYIATLYAIGQGGCIDSIKRTIRLFSSAATLTYTPLIGCTSMNVNFHVSTPGPVKYFWDFGDGNTLNSTDSSVSNNYLQAGAYVPKVILTDSTGCQIPVTGIDSIYLIKNTVNFAAIDSAVCFGSSITFNDSSLSNSIINGWHWNFGDGNTSTIQNPTHLYTNGGSYAIQLIVHTTAGCTDSLTKNNYIQVYKLKATFGAFPLSGCSPLPILFSDTSSTEGLLPVSNWQYNFGDGATANFTTPPFTHTYNSGGYFIPQLKITNALGCSDSISLNNPVFVTAPKASFNSLDTVACIGSNVIFNNTSIGIKLLYTWTFGNSLSSTQKNPTTTYSVDSSFPVKLVVTDSIGCMDSLLLNNYIKTTTTKASFSVGDSISSCSPLVINFTNTSINTTSIAWNFGDGKFSNATNPTHSYFIPNTYIATLTTTGPAGCIDSAKHSFQLFSSIDTLTYSPTQSCSPLTVNFHITAHGPVSYAWNFGDGNTQNSLSQDVSHTYSTPGNYVPRVIITDTPSCKIPVIGKDTIHFTKSLANFKAIDSAVCVGTTIAFKDSSATNSKLVAWHWDFGDGDTSSLQNPIHLYGSTGSYPVKLVVYTKEGCADSVTKNNYIHIYGVKAKFGALPLAGCKPLNVVLTDSSVTDGLLPITKWQYNFGDGTIADFTAPPFAHLYDTSGYFIPTLKISNSFGCIDSIALNTALLVTAPKANFNSTDTISCIGSNVSFNNISSGIKLGYAWSFGNGISSTQQSPTTTFPVDSSFSIKLIVTDSIGCMDSLLLNNYIKIKTVKASFTVSDSVSSCAPLVVQFTNTSINDTSIVWNFGDGATSTQQNPTHTYSTAGTFTALLTATGTGGCMDSTKHSIQLYSSAAVLTYNPVQGCSQVNVNFHIAANGPVTYFWDFNDGDTINSILPDISHTYLIPGSYVPKVIVKGTPSCQTPVVGIDTIHVTKSYVNFAAIDSAACYGTSIAFKDSTISNATIDSWHWDFGDGNSSALQSPTYLYTLTGIYPVKLTVYTKDGCADSLTKNNYVHIYGVKANFDATTHAGCKPLNVAFTDNSSTDALLPITNWQYNFGDGIINNFTAAPFTHLYTTAGYFIPTLKVSDSFGCTDSIALSKPVIVTSPKAAFNSTDTASCIGSIVSFNNISTGINLNYTWLFGNGISSTQQNPTTTYTVDSNYSVKLIVTDSIGCIDSLLLNNYIKTQTAKASFAVSDSVSSCTPFTIQFTNTSINDTSLIWDFGDGITSIISNPKHTYSTAGNYIVTLKTMGTGGCIDSAKHSIQLFSSATAFNYSPIQSCSTVNVNFHIAASGPVTYFWDFNDGNTITSTLSDIMHTYSVPGSYLPKVTINGTSGCNVTITGMDSIHFIKSNVNFIAADSAVCFGSLISFTNTTTGNSNINSWHWNFGDGTSSLQNNATHLYNTIGNFSVQLIATTVEGCSDTTLKNNYISINQVPDVAIAGDTSACIPASLIFKGVLLQADTSTLSWQWHFGNGNTSGIQNPPSQQYKSNGNFPLQLIVTSLSGCADTINKTIIAHPLPITEAGVYPTICANTSLQLQASGADSYSWSPAQYLSCVNCSNPVTVPGDSILYHVTGATLFGCKSTDSVYINVLKKFTLTVSPKTDSICIGQSVQLLASGTDNYLWTPENGLNNPKTNAPIVTPGSSTTYKVVASDKSNCFKDSSTISISVFLNPTVVGGPFKSITQGESVMLTPQYSPDVDKWDWSPIDGLSCSNCANPVASPAKTETYIITVSNATGCTASDSISVILPCIDNVFIPNTFSPNGDGNNDIFFPRGKNIYKIQSMRIFDRLGALVFQQLNFAANDDSKGWKGIINGKQASSDVYIYVIEIMCTNYIISTFKGNITLIR